MDTFGELTNIQPRVIIHGGAGNITKDNLSPALWIEHRDALMTILQSTRQILQAQQTTAIDAAEHAVSLLEENPLFNAGKGAVFNLAGENELEASIMVSRGKRKRGAAVSLLRHVKSPIKAAALMLRKGEDDNGGGAQGHVHLSGGEFEKLAEQWGLEMVDNSYFWTRKRWDEHKKGLERVVTEPIANDWQDLSQDLRPDGTAWSEADPGWNGHDYLPQGTVGCVVLDRFGTLAVATSTGGLTNKIPGRIGDTPTFGAGFWAEEWSMVGHNTPHGVAMSGTGNGDYFLRVAAANTTASLVRFSTQPRISLAHAVQWMAGPGGELQRAAGSRWGQGDGEGGLIGIEMHNGKSRVVFALNCGGMFRAWVDDAGNERCQVFRDSTS